MSDFEPNVENPYAAPSGEGSPVTDSLQLTWVEFLFSFKGRISRHHYWLERLALIPLYFCGIVVAFGLKALFGDPGLGAGMVVALLLPCWSMLATEVKRYHDLDKSGLWMLVGVIPLLGPIWTFINAGCTRGTVGPNQYGPDPTGHGISKFTH